MIAKYYSYNYFQSKSKKKEKKNKEKTKEKHSKKKSKKSKEKKIEENSRDRSEYEETNGINNFAPEEFIEENKINGNNNDKITVDSVDKLLAEDSMLRICYNVVPQEEILNQVLVHLSFHNLTTIPIHQLILTLPDSHAIKMIRTVSK